MSAFRPFDYFVIAIGMIGTLNAIGALPKMPQLVVVISGVVSALVCCFSIVLLGLNRYVRHLGSQQKRFYLYHIFANLVPTIYILTHLRETPWERFIS
jgi:hypothetical protein